MGKKIKVVQMGLGPIGNRVTQFLAERPSIQIMGAIDSNSDKEGQDIGTLAGLSPLGGKVTSDLDQMLGKGDIDIVVLTAASSLAETYEQLVKLLPYGVNIVSASEELSYPWLTNGELAEKIDILAKENNVTVFGTGDGTPRIGSTLKGGVEGDVGTCAILVNAIPTVVNACSGLRTMTDIEPPHFIDWEEIRQSSYCPECGKPYPFKALIEMVEYFKVNAENAEN